MQIRPYTLYIYRLLLLLLPLTLGGCSDDDDVLEIFTGKTWKLSYISAEGNHKWIDLWGNNDAAYQNSMKLLEAEGTFTLGFAGSEAVEGTSGGTLNGQGVNLKFTGTWRADGDSRKLILSLQTSGNDSDVLVKAFLSGLQNAFRYEGDSQNLFIYYKEGQVTRFMGFKPTK